MFKQTILSAARGETILTDTVQFGENREPDCHKEDGFQALKRLDNI